MNSDQVLIIGTGALATLFAARFSAAGIQVTMLGTWQEALTSMRSNGARIDGLGSFPVKTTDNPSICRGAKLALVLVKSWQTERAAHQLSTCLDENGIAVTLQNGLGNNTELAITLGDSRVALGTTTLGAKLLAPGIVQLAGDGPVVLEDTPRMSDLKKLFLRAGFTVNSSSNMQSMIWSKLVISSAINPLTALLRIINGQLLEISTARELMATIARESAMVADGLGIPLLYSDPVSATEEVLKNTAGNYSSMLQDVLRQSRTEIDVINGAIVRLAQEVHIEVPVNQVITSLINALPSRGKI
jgi:2-dehydropantoate 2-reductase